jgi:hypothetical protein
MPLRKRMLVVATQIRASMRFFADEDIHNIGDLSCGGGRIYHASRRVTNLSIFRGTQFGVHIVQANPDYPDLDQDKTLLP